MEDIPVRLVETLSQIIGDESIEQSIRQSAIQAFRDVRRLPAEIEARCFQVIGQYPPDRSRLPAEAALTLGCTDLPRHRAFLARIVAGWPADSLYPASEVHELLSEDPQ
jgi:hypothetical protein